VKYSFGPRLLEDAKSSEQRTTVLPILSAALEAVDPYAAVSRALAREGDKLLIDGRTYDLTSIPRVIAVGAGKAAGPMSQAVEDILGDRLADGAINVKRGHAAATRVIQVCQAGHPIPDQAGLEGTLAIVRLLQAAGPDDLVLCLISGGGSALLQFPSDGISLEDIQRLTGGMLRAGATINELNAVRKHLSQVSGGGLARLAQPSPVVTLLLSDVVGNPFDVVASGPTVPDTTTFEDARLVLERFGLWDAVSESIRARLEAGCRGELAETPKPDDPLFESVHNVLVASNRLAAEAAMRQAQRSGFHSLLLSTYVEGEAREVAKVCAALAHEVHASGQPLRRPCCLIMGGETTVTVRGQGRGGRNQELALSAAQRIAGLPDVLVVALATDGNDGPTDAAGAMTDGSTIERAGRIGLDPYAALADNDAYVFFERLGDLLLTGPTNTNVNDLIFVFAF
jgi:glycerate 2-kinase